MIQGQITSQNIAKPGEFQTPGLVFDGDSVCGQSMLAAASTHHSNLPRTGLIPLAGQAW